MFDPPIPSPALASALAHLERELDALASPLVEGMKIDVVLHEANRDRVLILVRLLLHATLSQETTWPHLGLDVDAFFRRVLLHPFLHAPCACLPTEHLARSDERSYSGITLTFFFDEPATLHDDDATLAANAGMN